jgi:dihydrofolate reductase
MKMRKLIMQMNISLDGIADHQVAMADDELHDFAADRLEMTDILVFGRVTYQLMESYWPHARDDPEATESMLKFADKYNALPKIVFSRTLQKADWTNTRIIRDNLAEEVLKLKQQSGKNVSVGGISLSQELMRLGLIDEYLLLVQPVIWGKGKRLFENLNDKARFKLIDTKTFQSGVVVLDYLATRS